MTDMEGIFGKSYGLNQSNVRHPDWARAYLDEMKMRGTRDEIILEYLRKAKAQGMRDACDEFEACGGYQTPDLMKAMREQADRIERAAAQHTEGKG